MDLVLDPSVLAFLESGVSIIVGTRDAANVPSVMRAVGARVDPVRNQVVVFIDAPRARPVLADIADNAQVAVVFSQPSTHRTVQIKAGDARIEPIDAADWPLIERYRATLAVEISIYGFSAAFAAAMLGCARDDVVALRFTPREAYDQTPGPKAGQPIGTRA